MASLVQTRYVELPDAAVATVNSIPEQKRTLTPPPASASASPLTSSITFDQDTAVSTDFSEVACDEDSSPETIIIGIYAQRDAFSTNHL